MDRQRRIYHVTILGSGLNAVLVVFKFLAGIYGHSSAMVADAVHSLSDFVSDIVVLLFVRISGKPQDEDHDYGHGKYETLATIIIGLLLGLVGIGLCVGGCQNIILFLKGHALEQPTLLALVAAVVSIFAKEGLYQYTAYWGRRIDSSVLKANAWHHRSDALTSVAALIGIVGAMLLGAKWSVLDPIAAVVVSLFILKSAYSLSRSGLDELMEKSLSIETKELITQTVLSTPGVKAMHRLRTRRIGPHSAVELHVKMCGDLTLREAHDIVNVIERRLKERLGIETHVGIHMEPWEEKDGKK